MGKITVWENLSHTNNFLDLLFSQDKFDNSFENYGEDDLPRLERELEEILTRFDDCTIEKYKLSEQIKEHAALVDTTVSLFEK